MKAAGWARSWAPVVVVAGAIFYFSIVRHPLGGIIAVPHADKLGHLVAYGVLGLLLARALGAHGSAVAAAVAAAVWASAYGGALEVVQPLVGRTADFLDLAADVVGAAAAVGAWFVVRRPGR